MAPLSVSLSRCPRQRETPRNKRKSSSPGGARVGVRTRDSLIEQVGKLMMMEVETIVETM
eukprot:768317-Hanusia_phi.AAC.6